MQSYINMILEDLGPGTPKKCYENLQVMIEENYRMKAKLKSFQATIEALKEIPNEAQIGNLKILLG